MQKKILVIALAMASLSAFADDKPLEIEIRGANNVDARLPDVVVTAQKPTPMQSNVGIGTRIPEEPIDMPRNIQEIGSNEIQNRGTQNSINDTMQYNVSGISVNADPQAPNRSNFMIRGFQVDDDWGTKIDGQAHLEWANLDLYNVERVEVQKGPGAANNGIGDPGGFINYVTKKADWTNRGEVNVNANTKGGYTTNVQQNYAINDALAGRTVVTWTDGPALQMNGRNNVNDLWLSQNFMAKLSSATTLQFDVRHVEHNQDFGAAGFLPAAYDSVKTLPIRTNLSSPQDKVNLKDTEVAYKLDHEFSDKISFHHDAKFQDSQRGYHYMMPYAMDGSTMQMSYYDYNNHKQNIGTDNYFTFKQDLFGLKNTLVTGAQFYRWHTNTTSGSTYPADGANCSSFGTYCVNMFNPSYAGFKWVYGNQAGSSNDGQGVNSGRNDNTAVGSFTENNFASYIQDQLYITDQLIFNGGVRYTYSNFSGTDAATANYNNVSPDLGLTYKFTNNFSVFADWAKGWMPKTQVSQALIEPQKSEQKEIGFKYIDDVASLTASYFNLNQTNLATFAPGYPNNMLFAGAVNVKGYEVDGSYKLPWVKGVTVKANYANLDARITGDGDPANIGQKFPSIPNNQFGSWVQYDTHIDSHAAGAGVGAIHVSDRFANIPNSIVLPSYTTVDLMAYYNITNDIKVNAYIKNVGNVNYYAGGTSPLGVMPGPPLVGMLSVQIKY